MIGAFMFGIAANKSWTAGRPLEWLGIDEDYGAYVRIELPPSEAFSGAGSYQNLPTAWAYCPQRR